MGRKKKEEEHENLERWLVSYADFITLLFAVFVVLYALSQLDLAKFKQLSVSIKKAFSHSPTILEGDAGVLDQSGENVMDAGGFQQNQNLVPPILDAIAAKEEEKNFELVQEELKLEKIDEVKGVQTRITERGLVIKLVGNVFFESSSPEIKKESQEVINRIGTILKEKFSFNLIRIEGHSDNIPIKSDIYPSNWELSSARASSITRYFVDITGIEKDRLVVVGYSDTRPIASNDTETGRNANRRVEIIVLRSKLVQSELQTYRFQKERLKRLKEIQEKNQKEAEKKKASDAAQKLLEDSKEKEDEFILFEDKYNKQSVEVMKDIKRFEKEESSQAKKTLFFNSVRENLKKDGN